MVARAEQELRPDINGALLIRAHVDRSVPIEAQLSFSIIGLRLDEAALQREAIDARDKAALRFGVNVARVGWIGKRPKPISATKVFPPAIADPAWILRIAHPHAVVLQPAKHVIRISVVRA